MNDDDRMMPERRLSGPMICSRLLRGCFTVSLSECLSGKSVGSKVLDTPAAKYRI